MATIEHIQGVGAQFAEKLKAAGAATVEALLDIGATPKGREGLAAATGIAPALISRWVNHADLFRIKGVAGQFSELLEAAGVDTVPELAQRNPENLHQTLVATNLEKKISGAMPSLAQVISWVNEAKSLPRIVHY